MEIVINDLGQLRKQIKVAVPLEEIQKKYQDKLSYVQKNIQIRGFRPGKIPARVVQLKFGQAMNAEVKAELLHEIFEKLETEHKIRILGEPNLPKEWNVTADAPATLEFTVDSQPNFELAQYKGLEVKQTEVQISEEELTEHLNLLRRSKGTLMVVENEPTQEEDFLIADVLITVGETKIWEKANSNINVADTSLYGLAIPKDKLVGRKVGEAVEFTLPIPADYEIEEHRGKEAKISFKVQEIKRLKLADLDDTFAVNLGCTNLDDLKGRLREQMLSDKKTHQEVQTEEELLERLLTNLNVELPEAFIADRVAHAKEHFEKHKKEQGETDIEAKWKEEEPKLYQEWRERVKEFFLISRIVEIEKVSVTEEDLNEYFHQMSWQLHRWPNEIRNQYEQLDMMDEVKYEVRKRKVMSILRENAKYIS